MTVFQSVKEEFLREPRRSKIDWIPFGFGIVLIAFSIAGILVDDARGGLFSVGPEVIFLGLAFAGMGGAELLPVDRHRVSALLRVITIAMFFTWLAARVLMF